MVPANNPCHPSEEEQPPGGLHGRVQGEDFGMQEDLASRLCTKPAIVIRKILIQHFSDSRSAREALGELMCECASAP